MLDIQFLSRPTVPNQSVIYVYENGCLKTRVLETLQTLAEADGSPLFSSSPRTVLSQGLFQGRNFCEWPDAHQGCEGDILRGLALLKGWHAVIFASRSSALLADPDWTRCVQGCIVLEERPIWHDDLSAALRFLHESGGLAPALDINAAGFRAHYQRLMEAGPIVWPDLVAEFERDVLLSFDPESGVFERSADQTASSLGARILLVRNLQLFLDRPDDVRRLSQLVATVERRYLIAADRKHTVAELYLSLERLMAAGTSKHEETVSRRAIEFCALLMSREASLLKRVHGSSGAERPDAFIFGVDAVLRTYARSIEQGAAEVFHDSWRPLEALWRRVRQTEGGFLAHSRRTLAKRIVQNLSGAALIRLPHLERFYRELTAAFVPGVSVDAPQPPFRPRNRFDFWYNTFSEVAGQPTAVEPLAKRISQRQLRGAMVLSGPPGAGKRSLARLFAKALLCSSPTPDPCGRCHSCTSFRSTGQGGTLGYTELSAGAGLDFEGARALIQLSTDASLANNSVIVVDRAELLDHAAADMMLHALEHIQRPTTFIFLARDLSKIRPALLSRCASWRVTLLTQDQAEKWTDQFCSRHALKLEATMRRFAAQAGGGSPARTQRILAEITRLGTSDVASARRVLDLEWIDKMVAYWRNTVNGEKPVEWRPMPNEQPRMRTLMRYLTMLQTDGRYIHDHQDDPAVSCADHAQTLELLNRFNERSNQPSIPRDTIWSSLVSYCLECRAASFPALVDFANSLLKLAPRRHDDSNKSR